MHHKLRFVFHSSSPNFWQQLLSSGTSVSENKAERNKLPLPPQSTKRARCPGCHQLIQSSVSHCYTHGQQKASRILINNVIHAGRGALNPGILAVCCFPSSFRSQQRCWELYFFIFFPHSRIHATGLDAYGREPTLEHFVTLQIFAFRCSTSFLTMIFFPQKIFTNNRGR